MKNPQKSCHYRPFVHVPSMLRWSLWYWGKFTSLFGKPMSFPFWENSLVVEPTPPKNDGVNVSWDEDIPNIGKKTAMFQSPPTRKAPDHWTLHIIRVNWRVEGPCIWPTSSSPVRCMRDCLKKPCHGHDQRHIHVAVAGPIASLRFELNLLEIITYCGQHLWFQEANHVGHNVINLAASGNGSIDVYTSHKILLLTWGWCTLGATIFLA